MAKGDLLPDFIDAILPAPTQVDEVDIFRRWHLLLRSQEASKAGSASTCGISSDPNNAASRNIRSRPMLETPGALSCRSSRHGVDHVALRRNSPKRFAERIGAKHAVRKHTAAQLGLMTIGLRGRRGSFRPRRMFTPPVVRAPARSQCLSMFNARPETSILRKPPATRAPARSCRCISRPAVRHG